MPVTARLLSMSGPVRRVCSSFSDSSSSLTHAQRLLLRRVGPLLLLFILLVYLLLGAIAFLQLEHTAHEQAVRRFFFQLAVNRRQAARRMASNVFNAPNNTSAQHVIIVDRLAVERVQQALAHSLREYEAQLTLALPNRHEWTMGSALCYAWGLLTTVGHGERAPRTGGGQVFALVYCLLGVPYFVLCLIAVGYRVFDTCRVSSRVESERKRSRVY